MAGRGTLRVRYELRSRLELMNPSYISNRRESIITHGVCRIGKLDQDPVRPMNRQGEDFGQSRSVVSRSPGRRVKSGEDKGAGTEASRSLGGVPPECEIGEGFLDGVATVLKPAPRQRTEKAFDQPFGRVEVPRIPQQSIRQMLPGDGEPSPFVIGTGLRIPGVPFFIGHGAPVLLHTAPKEDSHFFGLPKGSVPHEMAFLTEVRDHSFSLRSPCGIDLGEALRPTLKFLERCLHLLGQ